MDILRVDMVNNLLVSCARFGERGVALGHDALDAGLEADPDEGISDIIQGVLLDLDGGEAIDRRSQFGTGGVVHVVRVCGEIDTTRLQCPVYHVEHGLSDLLSDRSPPC